MHYVTITYKYMEERKIWKKEGKERKKRKSNKNKLKYTETKKRLLSQRRIQDQRTSLTPPLLILMSLLGVAL